MFLANIQVLVGTRPAAEVQDAIERAVRQQLAAEGFVAIAAGNTDAALERTVFLARSASGRWIAVYDERVEFGGERAVCDWAAAISAGTDGAALGIHVEDSDVVSLFLFKGGTPADAFVSDPLYPTHGSEAHGQFTTVAGQPERWSELLVAGATPMALRVAWDQRPLFAEDRLTATLPLLGLDERLTWMGWQDALAEWQSFPLEQADEPIPGIVRLAFRGTDRAASQLEADGPPWLSLAFIGISYGTEALEIVAGAALPRPHLNLINMGGSSRGLRVRCWGSALDKGLLEVTGIQVVVGPRMRQPSTYDVPVPPMPSTPHAPLDVTISDLPIPPGLTMDGGVPIRGDPKAIQAAIQRTCELTVTLVGIAKVPGYGQLLLNVVPLLGEQVKRKPTGWPIEVRVTPPRTTSSDTA
jgi:hypothetical protein